MIDELRIWDTVVTGDDIAENNWLFTLTVMKQD